MNKHPDYNSNLYVNLFSSCIGTLTAEILTLPICRIKTIYQNNKKLSIKSTIDSIVKTHGLIGFFNSLKPALITQMVSTSIKFTLYEKIKNIRKTDKTDIFDNVINGIISGLIGSLISHPLDVWKNFVQRNENYLSHIKKSKSKSFGNLIKFYSEHNPNSRHFNLEEFQALEQIYINKFVFYLRLGSCWMINSHRRIYQHRGEFQHSAQRTLYIYFFNRIFRCIYVIKIFDNIN